MTNRKGASLKETIVKDHKKSGRSNIYDELRAWPTSVCSSRKVPSTIFSPAPPLLSDFPCTSWLVLLYVYLFQGESSYNRNVREWCSFMRVAAVTGAICV